MSSLAERYSAAASIGVQTNRRGELDVQTPMTIDHAELRAPTSAGAVSVRVWEQGTSRGPLVLLAHGAGSNIDHPVHTGVCAAVASRGATVATFNFPYAEAGRRAPDSRSGLLTCYADVAAWAADRFGRPIAAGGRSMGGRMASLLAADGHPFAGLVLLNYPLIGSRGGTGSPPRTAHWPDLTVPILFVHGTRDRLFPADVFDRQRHLLRVPVTVHAVDHADHVFSVPRRANRTADDVYAEVADAVDGWLATLEPLR